MTAPTEDEEGTPWWVGLPPVDVMIECDQGLHTLRWAEGTLSAPDHPEAGKRPRGQRPVPLSAADVTGGGCDVALRAWRAYRHDPRVLAWGRRHPGETLRASGPAADEPLAVVLATLEPSLERRLQAESALALADDVLAEEADDGSPGEATTLLEAATTGRAASFLERWLDPRQPYDVHVGPEPGIEVVDGRAIVTVGPTWIGEVWSRYLALIDGFFVLRVLRIVEDRAQVVGVGRPGGDPAKLTVAGPAPWRARDREPL